MRAARTPPEPAPMTKKIDTSEIGSMPAATFGQGSREVQSVVALFLHLLAHARHHIGRELALPALHGRDHIGEDRRLRRDISLARRAAEKGDGGLEVRLAHVIGEDLRGDVGHLVGLLVEFRLQRGNTAFRSSVSSGRVSVSVPPI